MKINQCAWFQFIKKVNMWCGKSGLTVQVKHFLVVSGGNNPEDGSGKMELNCATSESILIIQQNDGHGSRR
jgi:hypothetical protein